MLSLSKHVVERSKKKKVDIIDHFELTDPEFERQFESCRLSPELFNHEAYLRLAWIHISKYGIEKAMANIPGRLKNFVNQVGAANKYNLTLTVAAVRAVYHFVLKSNSTDFKGFCLEFPRLKYKFKELMAAHCAIDIFNSKLAKTAYIEPDLVPFD